jgi:hypothetical protein
MRQKLNENPVAQVAIVCVLLLGAGYVLLTSLSGGGEEAEEPSTTTTTTTAPIEAAAAPEAAESFEAGVAEATASASATAASTPAERTLPQPVETAYENGATLVLLIVHDGGIDDRLVARAARVVEASPGVSFFAVPVGEVARYAPITGPLGVDQAPALIVVRPLALNGGEAAPATVTYGYQSAADIRQAVRDATYQGPQLTYAPN